jgi:hypothetical protein
VQHDDEREWTLAGRRQGHIGVERQAVEAWYAKVALSHLPADTEADAVSGLAGELPERVQRGSLGVGVGQGLGCARARRDAGHQQEGAETDERGIPTASTGSG